MFYLSGLLGFLSIAMFYVAAYMNSIVDTVKYKCVGINCEAVMGSIPWWVQPTAFLSWMLTIFLFVGALICIGVRLSSMEEE